MLNACDKQKDDGKIHPALLVPLSDSSDEEQGSLQSKNLMKRTISTATLRSPAERANVRTAEGGESDCVQSDPELR